MAPILAPAQRRPQLSARLNHSQEFPVSREDDAARSLWEMPRQVRLGRSAQCGDLVGVDERDLPVRAMHLEEIQRNEQHGPADYR